MRRSLMLNLLSQRNLLTRTLMKLGRHFSKHKLYFFNAEIFEDPDLDAIIYAFVTCNNATTKPNKPYYERMKPFFN